MKLFVHTEHVGVMGTRTRMFHANGTEIKGLAGLDVQLDALGLTRVKIELIGVEVVSVDRPHENTAQQAIEALRELVAVKQAREEVMRRKQRRLCSISRDPKEVRAVDRLREECKIREARAWNVARAIVSKESGT